MTLKEEYSKLSQQDFPITHEKNPAGIGVTLCCCAKRCEASLHRYERGSFYIGSARDRLGPGYSELYRNFLKEPREEEKERELSAWKALMSTSN